MCLHVGDPITFGPMVLSADHITNAPSTAVPNVTLRRAGDSFRAAIGALNPIGNGMWELTGNVGDTGIPGSLCLHATATGCDPFDFIYHVEVPTISDGPVASQILNQLTNIVSLLSRLLNRNY